MAFPVDPVPVVVEIAPGADPAGDPAGWTWVDITASVRLADRIEITQGRLYVPEQVEPATCRMRLDNRTGDFTPRNPYGQWYGQLGRNTPLRVRILWGGVYYDRFSGFVSSWPPRWDKSGNDATVPIQADGVLRRLGQGSPPARSPLRRTITATTPAAYWPGEDGITSTQLASAIPGHPAMTVSGTAEFVQITDDVNIAGTSVTLRYGSAAVVNLAGGAELYADVPVDVTTATASVWTVHVRGVLDPAIVSGNFVVAEWTTPGGTYVRWQVLSTAVDTQVIGYTTAGASTVLLTGVLPAGLAVYAVSAQQSGGNINITYSLGGSTSVAGTLAGVATLASNTTNTTATGQVPFGHFAVWAASSVPYNTADTETDAYGETIYSVGLSARLEAAHLRLARLCAEDGVQLTVPAVDSAAVTRMGWQAVGTPLDLYRQCETADQGVLYESGFGLAYLPRDSRYNRSSALTIDFAAGHVAEPPQPVDDDQFLHNRVTVSRVNGSEVTAEDVDSIAAVGAYQTAVEVNLATDRPLSDHASWRVHLGTVDEMRWPYIDLNLARSPGLIGQVLACGVQSRVRAVNPPDEVAGDDIDEVVEGYSETIGFKDWLVSLNLSPARPWDVATVDGEQRVSADGSTLAAGVTASATTLSLASTTANGLWTTAPADFPLDLRVGGERVTVSAISGASSPQTVTVTARAVNGVARAWPAGTEIDVWQPAVSAL